jgi:hypothetical protein
MGSFASSYLAPLGEYVANGNYYGRTFFAATVGGTVSSIGGGKFANGAVTSAFQFMFNDALHNKNVTNLNEGYIKNLRSQIVKMNKHGSLDLLKGSTWAGENRYIYIAGENSGEWFDLKHALVSSRVPLGAGALFGLGWETSQLFTKWSSSAFLNEDLFSNAIGAKVNIYSTFSNSSFVDIMVGVIHSYGSPISASTYKSHYGY